MIGYTPITPLTKDTFLGCVTEEEVMEELLGRPVSVGEYFCSPFRQDRNPSCILFYKDGRLRFRDWTDPSPKDIFDLAKAVYHTSNFGETLRVLADKFDFYNRDPLGAEESERLRDMRNAARKREKKLIEVTVQPFTQLDADYLSSYGITQEIASKFNCYSIARIWIDGESRHVYSSMDPSIGYYFGLDRFGNQKWKIYFYKRGKGPFPRFLSNTNRIAGWIQMPDVGERLTITKSSKDVMVLYRLGITAIAMQSESTMPYPRIIEELRVRFDHINSLYDFDRAGVTMANRLRKQFGIPAFFLTNGRFNTIDYGAKDISDYVKANGVERARQLVECL